jgi:hypothetical protein
VRGLHAQGDAAELEVLVHAELAEQVAALRHEGDAARQQLFLRGAADVGTIEQDAALARPEQAEQGLQHGGLAGPVGPDQQRDRAAPGLEGAG